LIPRDRRKERNRKMMDMKWRYKERKRSVDNKKCKEEIEMRQERGKYEEREKK
jgi:hypothetical protein